MKRKSWRVAHPVPEGFEVKAFRGRVAKLLTLNFRVADPSWFSKGRAFEFSVFLPLISQDRRESSQS